MKTVSAQSQVGTDKAYFSAGQKYNDIKNEKFRPIFNDLDLDHDGELSNEEISAYKNYSQLKKDNSRKHEALKSVKHKANSPIISSACAGAAGAVAGAVGSNSLLKTIHNAAKEGSWFNRAFFRETIVPVYSKSDNKMYSAGEYMFDKIKISSTPLKKGLVIASGLLLAGLAGYSVYKLVSKSQDVKNAKKEAAECDMALRQEDSQIRVLDRQYQHINAMQAEAQLSAEKSNGLTEDEMLGLWFFCAMPYIAKQQEN